MRQLLEATCRVAEEVLRVPLQLTMVELERALFQSAEKARNSQIQSDVYAQLRLLRARSEEFPALYFDAVAAQLAQFKEPARPNAEVHAAAFKSMTLVEDTDIDRDIVLSEMARRESIRGASPLLLLGQRFAVLAAQPAFDPERLPLGPYALCRALRDSGEQMQFTLETQLLLYQVFERQVMSRHAELTDRLNIQLAREGVLPGLVYRPYLPRPSAPRGTGAAAGNKGAAAASAPLTGWQGQAPAASWAELSNEVGMPAPTASAAPTSPTTGPADSNPAMGNLHELLDAARRALAKGAQPGDAGGDVPAAAQPAWTPPATSTVPVPTQSVMNVLGKLQAAPAPSGGRRSIGDIHGALLSQVKAEHGPTAALSAQDTDTLDLLGMLYSQLQREVRTDGPANDLLSRLQVPLARAAISDPEFFLRDQHPARELLNAVAESGAVWLSEDDADPLLLYKLGEAVNQVVNDYQGDEAVFAQANEHIQSHLRAAARRAEVSERRQIEAARGKERLEAAKQLANQTIDTLCQDTNPPKFVQTLLRKPWADVLTLTLLRHGEGSEEWKQREQATARISEVTSQTSGETDIGFAEDIEQSLLQVGYHRDEAGAIARRLSTPGGEDDILSRTELAAKLKARARLGEAEERDGEPERHKPPQAERNAAESAHYQQLRTLPFGTWFEFTVNQQGDNRRQRLSWYSLVTDNALFVNQRGQKVAELSLDAMARLMAKGQLRIVTEDRGRLIDRAWQATVRALRSIAGNAPNAVESA
ncbi:DUF1631 domain-containing protein [Stenotrophomonas sp. SY1]|uniref:DUF1631 domain-containing protein n=1 Tax=Stenotrophomonas sp. SY1 TaxID=477235 RepID=UPI001E6067B0|nr:DUF1631 domain-containing protein [Stenotrophomonas sp. SY1]